LRKLFVLGEPMLFPLFAVVLTLALAMPALAQTTTPSPGQGGSLPLSDVLIIAKPYPNLQTQVRLRLLATGLTKDKVTCAAQRFPNSWPQLGGARVAPYTCLIGKRTLTIAAERTYYDKAGYKLKADDPSLVEKAARVTETRLKWSWK
jgi:hypothetical protein